MSRALRVIGEVAYVSLSQGYEAIIDAADIALIDGRNWSALVSKRRKAVYAARVITVAGKQQMLLMHRVILSAPDNLHTDHIDGNGLNNRRRNLRLCSQAENNINTPLRADNKSGFKGVFFDTRSGRWRSEIRAQGKTKYLGLFDAPELAHAVYCEAATQLHGKFARTT